MEFLQDILPIVLYCLGIILLTVLIILSIKLIHTVDKTNKILDDAYNKTKSLSGIFTAIDRITDGLNLERGSIKSAAELGQAVADGLETSRRSNEVARVCTNAIIRSIEDDQKFLENLRADVSGYFDATDYALKLAIERAELYESIISTYNEANRNSGENSEKSE